MIALEDRQVHGLVIDGLQMNIPVGFEHRSKREVLDIEGCGRKRRRP
jgi:hypothetical protein